MAAKSLSTPIGSSHAVGIADQTNQRALRHCVQVQRPSQRLQSLRHPFARVLIRPQPGFYVMRLRSGAPLVPAVIYQLCPMVIPQPGAVYGPHPDEWCRPLDRSPRYEARIDGKRVDLDRVWTARSLRTVSFEEFQFRSGPLRRWARQTPGAPEAHPEMRVDLNRLPPLLF
jgi:hypothetical protein